MQKHRTVDLIGTKKNYSLSTFSGNSFLKLPMSTCFNVIVCPLGAVWAYYIKVPYLLVWHRKWLCMQLNKVMLCFPFVGSRQSLKVHEVKCVPRRPRYYVPCSI